MIVGDKAAQGNDCCVRFVAVLDHVHLDNGLRARQDKWCLTLCP